MIEKSGSKLLGITNPNFSSVLHEKYLKNTIVISINQFLTQKTPTQNHYKKNQMNKKIKQTPIYFFLTYLKGNTTSTELLLRKQTH
jgi:hypothetical protein